ncbi:NAD-dependent succinate-semialdehyde dehydrogenase [Varunaivibrio sulfuroxidans]|uniref:Succinate semialdehyde dehydrogenase n=1 Tax=Varunaivibrio sulfuroxidans TaxID=1773489 RepID=A0A4R3JEK2_9PROT|nr:NAD-dependent succinate-semialdehyde dehydrogenase [Varunaivibrio sulfuroxidans]TCS63100.1 succinate semialdehyde dehydrogenase [Varunaivibrio sulfuroxidans]WES31828.1 NAD-dependent succinate-semialdehyde dehydrogenase [Varunaivibrio sulfuroxidans]
MIKKHGLYIDGQWRAASDGQTKDVYNPATEEVIATIAAATQEDLDAALAAARQAFKAWRKTSPWERSKKLRAVAERIRARAEDIGMTMTLETGKPLAEAVAETNAAADQFEWYSEETKRIYGQTIEGRTPDVRMSVVYQPVGVVAAFSAWNFPALLPARKMAAAMAAGCSIIIKPAGEAPGSCFALAEACHDEGIPAGVVNVVSGASSLIAPYLVKSPIVRKVSLTGSVSVGKQILHMAADGVKKVTMELGGHGPVIVFADGDAAAAGKACATTKFRNCGQVCISPSRFFVHESRYDTFCAAFSETAKGLKIGPGVEEGVQVGPMANRRGLETAREMIDDAVARGAEILSGGKTPDGLEKGFFIEPTVLGRVSDDAKIMNEEPFAPVAPITTFTDYDDVIARANALPFGLAGYVFTQSLRLAHMASDDLEVGMVGVNEMLLATAEAPFGGVKESGMGREGGALGIHDYLEPKYVKMKL